MAFAGTGGSFQGGLAGRRAGGFWPKKCFILFHFVPFPIWGLGRLGTDLGGFDARMGRNGTHLGRNGTLVWALAAAARRGYLPGRGAAHGGIIARAFVRCQMPCGRTLRLIMGSQPLQVRRASHSLPISSRPFSISPVALQVRIGSGCCSRGPGSPSPSRKPPSRPTPEDTAAQEVVREVQMPKIREAAQLRWDPPTQEGIREFQNDEPGEATQLRRYGAGQRIGLVAAVPTLNYQPLLTGQPP